MNKFTTLITSLGLAVAASGASAMPIVNNLTLAQEAAPGIQQAAQGPCVIGDPSCNSNTSANIATFTTLPAGGNVSSYDDILSPIYSVGAFRQDAGDLFDIGIDINVTGGNRRADHELIRFVAFIDDVETFAYRGTDALSDFLNPGNGFSDWRLSGFDLTGVADASTIQFALDLGDVDAGRDQFFVIPGPTSPTTPPSSVPEPGSLGLLSLALLGLAFKRSMRR